MKKTISSELTLVYKFIFPTAWIGLFGIGTISMLLGNDPGKWMFLTILILGILFIAWLCIPLKRVMIEGQDLIISNFFRSVRVPLNQILNVTENQWINIHPVCIHFRRPTDFGQKVTFMPTLRMFSLFNSHPVVSELKQLAELNR